MKLEEEELFKEIFENYCHVLYRYIYHQVGCDKETAKDILDDVWEVLIKKFDSIAYNEEYLKSWLFAVAANKVKNHMRRKSTLQEIPYEQEQLLYMVDSMPRIDAAERLLLEEYVAALRPIEQKVLLERLEGNPYREISKRLNRSEQALQCLYSRTIKKLQEMISGEPGWC